MEQKVLKILVIFICSICIINCTYTYAGTVGDALTDAKDFLSSRDEDLYKDSLDKSQLSDASSSIYNALLMISFVVVAVVGITLGIKFMMANAEEKADIKKSLIIFLIGTIVVYGAFGIWKVAVNFLKNTF